MVIFGEGGEGGFMGGIDEDIKHRPDRGVAVIKKFFRESGTMRTKREKGEVAMTISREVAFFSEWVKSRDVAKAYLVINPGVEEEEARVEGEKMLRELEVDKVLKVYSLDMDAYLKQLKAGLEATKWIDDGEGMVEVEDHSIRRQYHKILGELLKLENTDEKGNIVLKGLIVLQGIQEEKPREVIDIDE